MFHRLGVALGIVSPDTIYHSAPVGAWIPPTVEASPLSGVSYDGGRPVMDAAAAAAHNEALFHGSYVWGIGCAVLLVLFAWAWVRLR